MDYGDPYFLEVDYQPDNFQFVITLNSVEDLEFPLPTGTLDISFSNVTLQQAEINYMGFGVPGKSYSCSNFYRNGKFVLFKAPVMLWK